MLFRLIEQTSTNDQCISFLQNRGVLRSSYHCIRCQIEMRLQQDRTKCDGCRFRCPDCRHTVSIRQGTFLQNAKLSLREFIWMAYLWAYDTPNKSIGEHLSLSEPTVVDWLNFLREICSWKLLQLNVRIGGLGKIVQIDESLIYKAKYNLGHALFCPTEVGNRLLRRRTQGWLCSFARRQIGRFADQSDHGTCGTW